MEEMTALEHPFDSTIDRLFKRLLGEAEP